MHKAKETPKARFMSEVERHLTGEETALYAQPCASVNRLLADTGMT